MQKPVIGITMGDGCGVGPEIIVKALADPRILEICQPLIIGDVKILQRAMKLTGSNFELLVLVDGHDISIPTGSVPCIDLDLLPADLSFGKISRDAGHAAYCYIERAVQMAMDGEINAICTAPLNKEALHLGGHHYPGHTEILAELSKTKEYAMLFSSPHLNVILVTTHVGLLESIHMITPEGVLNIIRLGSQAMQQIGKHLPKIAVCGINPHAGEGGLFGRNEESEKILPAIEQARSDGLIIDGPLPADTILYRAIQGDFDLVVAMYHDQGLIPVKTISMESAVNITVGLPFIRTSVDHGTAFDIAGKGIANEKNMQAAIFKAVEMVNFTHR